MTITRQQVDEAAVKRAGQRFQDRQLSAALQLIHTATPLATLTGSGEWDRYLQLIAGLVEQARAQEAIFAAKLLGHVVNHDEILALKLHHAHWVARAAALAEAMALPQEVLAAAARAKEKLDG